MAPFVCCLRFEAVATFCQVLLVGVTVTTSNLPRKQSRNATQGSGKVLRYCWKKNELHILKPEAIPDAKKKDSIPIGQSHASLSHPEVFGGGCFVQLRQEQQNVNKNAQRKVFRSASYKYHFILIFLHPEKFQGEKPMDFPPSRLRIWANRDKPSKLQK